MCIIINNLTGCVFCSGDSVQTVPQTDAAALPPVVLLVPLSVSYSSLFSSHFDASVGDYPDIFCFQPVRARFCPSVRPCVHDHVLKVL